MQVQKPSGDELNKLLRISNETAKAFKQPPLYTEKISSATNDGSRKLGQSILAGTKALGEALSPNPPSLDGPSSNKEPDMSSSFHISIGWTLNAPSRDIMLRLNAVVEKMTTDFEVSVNMVKVKIGNGITAVSLSSKIEASGGIISL